MAISNETPVVIPYGWLLQLAERLGAQDVDVCPTPEHICWRHRDFDAYVEPVVECRECWCQWILMRR